MKLLKVCMYLEDGSYRTDLLHENQIFKYFIASEVNCNSNTSDR